MLTRRKLLTASLGSAVMTLLPVRLTADAHLAAKTALTNSTLVYVTPVKSNGSLSSCQAEVWYAMLGPDVYVCAGTSSWRVQALKKGLTRTRMWIGDLGPWKDADYQSLPEIDAIASVETDKETLEKVLSQFGSKYASSWGTWGPRFRNGLADGSRTMLKYKLAG